MRQIRPIVFIVAVCAGLIPSATRGGMITTLYWTDAAQRIGSFSLGDSTISGVPFASPGGRSDIGLEVRNGAIQKFYVADRSTAIHRANPDGTGLEQLVTGTTGNESIALDLISNHIYWTEWNQHMMNGSANLIRRSDLDGANVTTLMTFENKPFPQFFLPTDIALDLANEKMYFSAFGGGTETTGIYRANLDGSGEEHLTTIFDIGELHSPSGLVLDTLNDRMFWIDRNRIYTSTMDGLFPTLLRTFSTVFTHRGIDIDVENGVLYWVESDSIVRASVADLLNNPNNIIPEVLLTPGLIPIGIALGPSTTAEAVPEPSTIALLLIGGMGLFGYGRRRKKKLAV